MKKVLIIKRTVLESGYGLEVIGEEKYQKLNAPVCSGNIPLQTLYKDGYELAAVTVDVETGMREYFLHKNISFWERIKGFFQGKKNLKK